MSIKVKEFVWSKMWIKVRAKGGGVDGAIISNKGVNVCVCVYTCHTWDFWGVNGNRWGWEFWNL